MDIKIIQNLQHALTKFVLQRLHQATKNIGIPRLSYNGVKERIPRTSTTPCNQTKKHVPKKSLAQLRASLLSLKYF